METPTLRIARPTDELQTVVSQYRRGLNFSILGQFENHRGFDGVILGHHAHPWHLEFTHHRGTSVGRAPTCDHLLVFYLADTHQWQVQCAQMETAGFTPVASYNPYWDVQGRTFEDVDGYRVVLQMGRFPSGVAIENQDDK